MYVNPHTAAILSSFFVITTIVSGCASSYDEDPVTFEDDNGEEVTVTKNSDGTETARYANGDEETFRRHDDGSLEHVSGTAGLIGALAVGYLLSRGFSGGEGYYNRATNRYEVTRPYQRYQSSSGNGRGYVKTPNSSNSTKSISNGNSTYKSSSPSTTTKPSVSNSAGGFGGAGARSASMGAS